MYTYVNSDYKYKLGVVFTNSSVTRVVYGDWP